MRGASSHRLPDGRVPRSGYPIGAPSDCAPPEFLCMMPMATSSTRWQQVAFLRYSMHREKNYPDQGEHYDYHYEEPDAAPDARVLHVLLLSGNDPSRGLRYALASDATSTRHCGNRIASEMAPGGRVNRVQERGSALDHPYPLSSTGASAYARPKLPRSLHPSCQHNGARSKTRTRAP